LFLRARDGADLLILEYTTVPGTEQSVRAAGVEFARALLKKL
jgi:hypothetical protein